MAEEQLNYGEQILQDKLRACTELGLLEPIPGFLERSGNKIKVSRPPTGMRVDETFELWRENHKDVLPPWVLKVNSCHVFYFKMWDVAHIVNELEVTQRLPDVLADYDKNINPANRAPSPG